MKKGELIEFVQGSSRNKLVISKQKMEGFEFIDIGKEFSMELGSIPVHDDRFSLKAKDLLYSLIQRLETYSDFTGRYIALTNLGILLEPELRLNFLEFIQSVSQTYPLILHWDGVIENDTLIFKTKPNGVEISLKGINHLFV